MRPLDTTPPLPPYPTGWYAVCFSSELARESIRKVRFMGHELVLFRTRSGQASAADAHCPHLGAHFGHGGTVEGEILRCPFHGFRYDGGGVCVATGYASKPPPTARLRMWPLREVNAMVLLYYDADGAPPAWEVPALDSSGWSAPIHRCFALAAHPQMTTENSVDLGHFSFVHGYRSVRMLRDVRVDGAYLSTAFAARRPAPVVGKWWQLDFEFETHIHGLGYSLVEVRVLDLEIRGRIWVLPTPTEAGQTMLYLATSIDESSGAAKPWLRVLPRRLRAALAARGLLSALAADARQDFDIWQNTRYLARPALAQGDGPIGRYRTWAAGFYGAGAGG